MHDFREFLLFHNVLKYLYEYFNISFIHDMQYRCLLCDLEIRT